MYPSRRIPAGGVVTVGTSSTRSIERVNNYEEKKASGIPYMGFNYLYRYKNVTRNGQKNTTSIVDRISYTP